MFGHRSQEIIEARPFHGRCTHAGVLLKVHRKKIAQVQVGKNKELTSSRHFIIINLRICKLLPVVKANIQG